MFVYEVIYLFARHFWSVTLFSVVNSVPLVKTRSSADADKPARHV